MVNKGLTILSLGVNMTISSSKDKKFETKT